jgi:endonuclease-3 related protein
LTVFQTLLTAYGRQYWWPGDTPFEVMVGAILTQNTAWTHVERAIANLVQARALDAQSILAAPLEQLTEWLRPSGYFNVKARRLINFCRWYVDEGEYEVLASRDTPRLRADLLAVSGIGPETADDILLYAFERPIFVVDAYTRRISSRLGWVSDAIGYEELRGFFESNLPPDTRLFNEYHALLVRHGKEVCRPRPLCGRCDLAARCPAMR